MKIDGSYHYSDIVSIRLKDNKNEIRVYPNPVKDGVITLQFSGMRAGRFTGSVFNASGQKVLQREVVHTGNTSVQSVALHKKLPHGLYRLRVEVKPGFST